VLVVLLVTAVVVAAAARWSARRSRSALAGLFEGPAQEVVPGEVSYIPRPAPNMSSYEGVDTLTSASLIARLATPSTYLERRPYDRLTIVYPPEGAVFPPNLCEPRVDWEDPTNDLWQVSVGLTGQEARYREVTEERQWWFPRELWEELRVEPTRPEMWIRVKGLKRSEADGGGVTVQVSRPVHFRFSQYGCDDYIVYRMVGVPFNIQRAPDTFVRDVRSFDETPFLLAREKYCFNCHTFSSKTLTQGKVAYQARYLGPEPFDLRTYFAIYDFQAKRGWVVKLPFDVQMTTFVAWSPDATKLALSANQYIIAARPVTLETQMAGENTSDLAIYDLTRNQAWLLPGADRADRLEIHPQWTPDGKAIVFATAPPGHHPAFVPFDLAVIPYNEGRGGEPTLIPGASANGRSNYFPRFSPDGRWLSFDQCDGGDLIRPSSDLYLMPADLQGKAHKLDSNAPNAADSWHSWSSNSHWLLFASKREDGIYARLYFTEIDEKGRASPAVRLPVRYDQLKSFNIPEFVSTKAPISEGQLYEAIRVEQTPVTVTLSSPPS